VPFAAPGDREGGVWKGVGVVLVGVGCTVAGMKREGQRRAWERTEEQRRYDGVQGVEEERWEEIGVIVCCFASLIRCSTTRAREHLLAAASLLVCTEEIEQ
jgi:hypothetical protein